MMAASATPTEAMERLKARLCARPKFAPPLPDCGYCQDTGWWEPAPDPGERGQVYRCPRGCRVPVKGRAA